MSYNFPSLPTVQQFKALVVSVVSPETKLAAQEHLANVRLSLKRFKADVAEVKRPHNDALKAIDAAAKPWVEMLTAKDQELERGILAYNRKVEEQVARENQKKLERFEVKAATAEAKAIAQGKPMPLVLPPALAAAPAKTEQVGEVKQTVVKRKAWRVAKAAFLNPDQQADPSLLDARWATEQGLGIPLEYFVLDTARVGKVIRAGGSIPGIEVYEEQSISIKG